jgi:hypothetical protein
MCKKSLTTICKYFLLMFLGFVPPLKSDLITLDVLRDPQTGCLVYLYGDRHSMVYTNEDTATWQQRETQQEACFNAVLDDLEKKSTSGKTHILIEGDPLFVADTKHDHSMYTVIRRIFDRRFDLTKTVITNIENRPASFFWAAKIFDSRCAPFDFWHKPLALSEIDPSWIDLKDLFAELDALRIKTNVCVQKITDKRFRTIIDQQFKVFENKYADFKKYIRIKVPSMEHDYCLMDSAVKMCLESVVAFLEAHNDNDRVKECKKYAVQALQHISVPIKANALNFCNLVIGQNPAAKAAQTACDDERVSLFDKDMKRWIIGAFIVKVFSLLMDLNIFYHVVTNSIKCKRDKVVVLAGCKHTEAVKDMLIKSGYSVVAKVPHKFNIMNQQPLSNQFFTVLKQQPSYRRWIAKTLVHHPRLIMGALALGSLAATYLFSTSCREFMNRNLDKVLNFCMNFKNNTTIVP